MTDAPETNSPPEQEPLSRRRALARLGLAAGVATYVAPLLTRLNEAEAQGGGCPFGYFRSMGTCVRY